MNNWDQNDAVPRRASHLHTLGAIIAMVAASQTRWCIWRAELVEGELHWRRHVEWQDHREYLTERTALADVKRFALYIEYGVYVAQWKVLPTGVTP